MRTDGHNGLEALTPAERGYASPSDGVLGVREVVRRASRNAGSPASAFHDHLYATFGSSWDDEDLRKGNAVETFDEGVDQLVKRTEYYARRSGATDAIVAAMSEMLRSKEAKRLLAIPSAWLLRRGIADLYKPKMHKVFSTYLRRVRVDFALHVRKSVYPLAKMAQEQPELFGEFARAVKLMDHASPAVTNDEWDALAKYASFHPTDVQKARATVGMPDANLPPVADTRLSVNEHGEVIAMSSGFVESSSHVETSLMQLVQQYTVRGQVRQLAAKTGGRCRISRLERLASSLGKLAGTVSTLNGGWHGLKIALFAGRRSSDRTYLLLQNLFCMRHLVGYVGTSSVQSANLVDGAMRHAGIGEAGRKAQIKALLGTHAHEMSSTFAQLLARFDDEAGGGSDTPCQVSTLCAHIVFVMCNGGSGRGDGITALPDTYGTDGFCAAARAAEVPPEFVEDMKSKWNVDIHPRTRVFDLVHMWRMDSGDYATVARTVLRHSAERRAEVEAMRKRGDQDVPPGPPADVGLMHSNLGSPADVLAVSRLPVDIRPSIVGFGTLADGFAPIELAHCRVDSPEDVSSTIAGTTDNSSNGEAYWTTEATISMASVVMKAVQAYHMDSPRPTDMCTGKLGDGDGKGKLELDPRVTPEVGESMRVRWRAMSAHKSPDVERVTATLRRAYVALTREEIYNK
ncbi:methylcrotonoyl-CoA carboxylase [Pseudoscourfieldia marina]